MSDFSDTPFVAGSLTGLRAFATDEFGRLIGPQVHKIFKPGENVAEHVNSWFVFMQDELPKGHQVGQVNCTCGYYAYFDGKNDLLNENRVAALVEGYGRCTVGSRGFRAEKARLVALVIPDRPRLRHPAWFDRMSDKLGPLSIPLGVLTGVAGVATAVGGSPALIPVGVALIVAALVVVVSGFHAISREHPRSSNLRRCFDDKRGERHDMVRRNYPDVPIYTSTKAALAEHPLTPPPAPTPEDEDFWTRGAVS